MVLSVSAVLLALESALESGGFRAQNILNLSKRVATDLSLPAKEVPRVPTELFRDEFCPTDILRSFQAKTHESVAQTKKLLIFDWSVDLSA